MKTCISCARLSVLTLALAAAFPVMAQSQTPTTLNDVVVTATRFPESAAPLPFGVSVITAEEIQASGVNSVNEAVMKLLGVPGRLDTSGGNNYTLDLRGFGETANSNQIVIVDGLRLNEADLSVPGLAHIQIDSVERIEVLRGTGSVLYGEGATGGVIVVTTKAGIGSKRVNSAQLYGAAGSNGLQDVRTSAVLAAGGFSMDVASDDRHSDGHRVNFASTSKSLTVSGQWSNDWLRLGARAVQHALDSGLPGSLTAAQYAADPRQTDPTRVTSKTDAGSIKKENTGIFAEASVGDWQLAIDANQRSKKDMSVVWGGLYGANVDASNYSLRARHDGKMGSLTNAFVMGYDEGKWDRIDLFGISTSANTTAVYLKDDLTLAPTGTRLSIGWRTEDIEKKKSSSIVKLKETQHAWELGVSQLVLQNLTVYGHAGNSFRLPNVDEFSFTMPGVSLKTQTSQDLELGARWKLATGQVDLRWYRNDLNNEIGYDPAGVAPLSGANVNFDPTQRQGVELEAKQAINAALDLRLNAALRQATFTAGAYAGNTVPLVPSQTLALHANWRFAAGHSLDGGLNWVSSQNPGGDFSNKFSIPAYTTVDVRYAYQLRNAELAFGVANLMDEKYYSQAYVNYLGNDVGIYPEAGRTFTASLRVKF